MAILLLSSLAARPAPAAITRVWAVGDGEKIYRYESGQAFCDRNSVWDGGRIGLVGLYSEVLAFQVIVEADSLGARAVEISVDPPVNRQSGRAIGSAGSSAYGPGGWIEVFSEHYVRVRQPNKPLWFFVAEANGPKRPTGWIPDALIPPDALPGRGGMPLDIPPTEREEIRNQDVLEVNPAMPLQNQGFWIDLYLPRDRSWPAGRYEGAVRVRSAGSEVALLPLVVEILPSRLPDENHSFVWMYNSDIFDYFPGIPQAQVEQMLKFTARRHRIDLVGGFDANRRPFDPELMERYRPYLDGSAYTPANGYQGPLEGAGEHLFPIGMYGSITGRAFGSEERARNESDRWVEWFDKNAPGVVYFWYMIDEPGRVQFPWITERASWVKNNPGPGRRLPIFITREYTPELAGSIDYWAGYHGVDLEMLPKLRAEGKYHWFYNGARPHYGSEILSAEAVDYRMNAWAKYIYGVDTWFLWESTHWTHNHQGPRGQLHQRVFSDPITFINWGETFGLGAGVAFYPGRMPYYPDEDRGLNRLFGSIRLKNIRRGQQDFEIMWLAEQKAGRQKVLEIVKRVVPKALAEADPQGPVPWSERGDDYDRARTELLELLK